MDLKIFSVREFKACVELFEPATVMYNWSSAGEKQK